MIQNKGNFLTKEKALGKCLRYFNHLGIFGGTKLCRLIGFGEDDSDFYYYTIDANGDKTFDSMVGGFYSIMNMGKQAYFYTNNNFSRIAPEADKFTMHKLSNKINNKR